MKKNLLKTIFMSLFLLGGMNMAWATEPEDNQEGTDEEEVVVEEYSMSLSVEASAISLGSEATVTVGMKNTGDVYGAIFTVVMPEEIEIVPGSAKMVAERNHARGGYTVQFAQREDGTYRFMIQPSSLDKAIKGNEGDLLTFSVKANEVVEDAIILISNIKLTDKDNKDIEATGDKISVNVVDGIVGEASVSAPASLEIYPGEPYKVDVAMENNFAVRAFEAVITLPEGFELIKDEENELFSYTERIPQTMTINSSKKEDENSYKVVISASDASVIAGENGTLFSFTVVAPENFKEDAIAITDVIAFDNAAASHKIESVTIKVENSVTIGINAVEAAKAEGAVIYNLAGQQMKSAKKGLYIINGKKVIR